MKDLLREHDFFIRRWQLRLVVAGLTIPPLLFVTLAFVFRREEDGSAIGAGIVAASFLLTALVLQGWRLPKRTASSRAAKGQASPG